MGWYKRSSKLVFDSFRSYINIIPESRNPIQESCSRIDNYASSSSKPSFSKPRIYEFSQSIFRNPTLLTKQFETKIPFLDGAKRFYYQDNRQVYHFKQRGYRRWFKNPTNVFIVVFLGSGSVITVYFWNLETVPYTKRTHFVLLSSSLEKQMGEKEFKKIKEGYKGKLLPALHPESIRVQKISQSIIDALQRGLSELNYDSESALSDKIGEEDDKWLSDDDKWHKEDEILDDNWVRQSRKEGREKGANASTRHLDGLKWEVIVVNEPMVNASCFPGGKIVVFTGLFEHFKSDAEIATIIGHEVGHAVARHSAEQMSKNVWLTILQLILHQFFMPDIVNSMSNLFLRLPFSRRMEMEADYIGLLLLASSGYDPRVAPQVYEKLGQVSGNTGLQDYLSTHPSGKKRAKLLAQAKVMEEALSLYRAVQAGRGGIEGFL